MKRFLDWLKDDIQNFWITCSSLKRIDLNLIEQLLRLLFPFLSPFWKLPWSFVMKKWNYIYNEVLTMVAFISETIPCILLMVGLLYYWWHFISVCFARFLLCSPNSFWLQCESEKENVQVVVCLSRLTTFFSSEQRILNTLFWDYRGANNGTKLKDQDKNDKK